MGFQESTRLFFSTCRCRNKNVTDLSFPYTTAEASAAQLLDRLHIFTFFIGTRSFLSGKVGCFFVAREAIDPRQVEN
jgi:hypothetical protein